MNVIDYFIVVENKNLKMYSLIMLNIFIRVVKQTSRSLICSSILIKQQLSPQPPSSWEHHPIVFL